MYLSRLLLNLRSREVWRDIADCHALHRTVMSAFPALGEANARATLAILHRIEEGTGGPLLYVQSSVLPDWSKLSAGYLSVDWLGKGNPAVRSLDEAWASLQQGQRLTFRLRANPTRKTGTGASANGHRVGLKDDGERLLWLSRKAPLGGFRLTGTPMDPDVPDVRILPERPVSGFRAKEQRVHFDVVMYEGHLTITDPEVFRTTLREGIGSGKAYGFGLLSIQGS